MTAGIEVRQAHLGDAIGIAEVHVQSWREAHAHLVPADALARLNVAQRAARWAEIILEETPEVWVATDDERIIGWATTSDRHTPKEPRDLELEAIYVLASHYGSGAAQLLLAEAIGDSPAFVWAAEDGPRALAFYVRNGFVTDGATKVVALAGTPVDTVRLVR